MHLLIYFCNWHLTNWTGRPKPSWSAYRLVGIEIVKSNTRPPSLPQSDAWFWAMIILSGTRHIISSGIGDIFFPFRNLFIFPVILGWKSKSSFRHLDELIISAGEKMKPQIFPVFFLDDRNSCVSIQLVHGAMTRRAILSSLNYLDINFPKRTLSFLFWGAVKGS